ncbi:N-substituted formamide deformylase precursor [Microbacterium oxydans]|uniref:N-substituted formamide deformylase n=1 Tax=Microbacterium oxydans TaxID=82380 RepID=A0A0F0KXG1_9MICO|nr:amidohydrolase family protein [Microbacterium oxydans]KJL24760.1 N-substituted formamide deformylase precursor [Microbacterium oxydans]
MTQSLHGDDADLIIRGGRIHTLDPFDTVTESLAIRDGVVVARGAEAEALDSRAVIELDGRTAIPGINDAHLHAAWLGARWPHLFFSDTSPEEQPSGRLVSTSGERRSALRRAWALLAELGITSYTEPGIGPGEDDGETGCFGSDMLDTYLELHRERAQTSRVTLLRLFGTLDGESTLDDFERGVHIPAPSSDPRWLAIPGVKIFADGIPPMATAWVEEPYADGTTGSLLTRGEPDARTAFRRMLELASARGLQIAVHATGDRSIAEFLSVLEGVHGQHPTPSGPHYVVHGDLATTEQIARMGRIGAGFAVQPLIAAHTHSWAAMQVGEARLASAWPLAEMLASDALTTITSDSPIASPDWRLSLDASLALLTAADVADDAGTRNRLLRSVTVDPARQDGASTWKGSLDVGMVADVTVLDEDPLAPGRDLATVGIARTIVDGRTVFSCD